MSSFFGTFFRMIGMVMFFRHFFRFLFLLFLLFRYFFKSFRGWISWARRGLRWLRILLFGVLFGFSSSFTLSLFAWRSNEFTHLLKHGLKHFLELRHLRRTKFIRFLTFLLLLSIFFRFRSKVVVMRVFFKAHKHFTIRGKRIFRVLFRAMVSWW